MSLERVLFFERTDLTKAQGVLRIMLLARTRGILCRVANTRRGIGDGVSCVFGRVANGACEALGGVTDGVAHATDCHEAISNLVEKEGERKLECEGEMNGLPVLPAWSLTPPTVLPAWSLTPPTRPLLDRISIVSYDWTTELKKRGIG